MTTAAPVPEIRVVLLDDHAMVRDGLARLLASGGGIAVVGQAADGALAGRLAAELRPDVALVDLAMPGVDGLEAARRIRAARPETRVVVLTAFSDRRQVLGALEAGAVGYLLKDAEPDDLVRAVHAAARGERPLHPAAAAAAVAAEPAERLTGRERQVLRLVAEGLPNKQIARRLAISEKTVKAHLTKVFGAIGVSDRTAAALWAHRNGIADSPASW